MTEEATRINLAMEQAGGNRQIAAVMLGLTGLQLKNSLNNSTELKERWCKSETHLTPGRLVANHRPAPLDPAAEPKEEDVKRAQAMALVMEAKAMTEDMRPLALPEGARALAVEMFLFNRKHFIKGLDMLAGGVSRQAIMMQHYMDGGWKRLNQVRNLIAATVQTKDGKTEINTPLRAALVDEEKALMDAQGTLLKILDDYFKTAFKAGETLANARSRLLPDGDTPKKTKPGFE